MKTAKLPSGKYIARATGSFRWALSKTGSPYLWVSFIITGGDCEGRLIGKCFSFAEESRARSIAALRKCGCTFKKGDVTDLADLDRNEVELVITRDEYCGRISARIKRIDAPGTTETRTKKARRMTPGQLAAFKERMKGHFLGPKATMETSRKPPSLKCSY
jgi:hypothetical protein